MKYIVTLKRKQTLNAAQNARMIRVEVDATSIIAAQIAALAENNNGKYFTVESVRRA